MISSAQRGENGHGHNMTRGCLQGSHRREGPGAEGLLEKRSSTGTRASQAIGGDARAICPWIHVSWQPPGANPAFCRQLAWESWDMPCLKNWLCFQSLHLTSFRPQSMANARPSKKQHVSGGHLCKANLPQCCKTKTRSKSIHVHISPDMASPLCPHVPR